jgi:hypothetical protein
VRGGAVPVGEHVAGEPGERSPFSCERGDGIPAGLPERGRVEEQAERGGRSERQAEPYGDPPILDHHPEGDDGDTDGHGRQCVDGEDAAQDERGPLPF